MKRISSSWARPSRCAFLDGSLTLDGEPFVVASIPQGHNFASFLAGLALIAPPLNSAAVGLLQRSTQRPPRQSASARTS